MGNKTYSIPLFVCLFVALLAPKTVWASSLYTHTPVRYREIGPGLWFAQVELYDQHQKLETLILVKVDPQKNRFRVIHDQRPKTIENWQALTGARVIFNGSYFRENYEPCALIISDGQRKGPLNRHMKGMFVAEPRKDGLPRAAILDLQKMGVLSKQLPWNQGLQSFPMLLDKNGAIRVDQSQLRASRTAIGTTRDGHVIVVHSEGTCFTLHDLAIFLKNLPLDLEYALNLDGGTAAELCIRTETLNYTHYGRQMSNYTGDFSVSLQSNIPLVIGIFPR